MISRHPAIHADSSITIQRACARAQQGTVCCLTNFTSIISHLLPDAPSYSTGHLDIRMVKI